MGPIWYDRLVVGPPMLPQSMQKCVCHFFFSSPLLLVTSPLSLLLWLLPLSEESDYTYFCHMSAMRLKSQAAATGACWYRPTKVALSH